MQGDAYAIDVHAHFISPESLAGVSTRGSAGVSLESEKQGIVVDVAGNRYGPLPPSLMSVDAQLEAMDATGIGHAVISPPPFLFCYGNDLALATEFASAQNNGIAEIVRRHPDRFTGIGTVPLQSPEAASEMLAQMMTDTGLIGVEIGTNVAGKDLDDPSFDIFWRQAAETGALVFIHPSDVRGVAFDAAYYLRNLVGNLLETSYCLSRLIFGGVLDRYPQLRILASHAGGFLPYTIGRLDHGYAVRSECQSIISRPPHVYLRQMYFDTISHSDPALRYLVDLVGADHVALGSDYPFDMGVPAPLHQLQAFEDAEIRRQVAHGTAAKLIGRD